VLLLAMTGQTKTPPIEQGHFDNAAQEIWRFKKEVLRPITPS
jgi:hypothetical protein